MTQPAHKSSDFPSIGHLLTSTWKTFVASLLRLFLVNLFTLVPLYILTFGVILGSIGGVVFSLYQKNTALSVGSIVVALVLFIVVAVISVIITYFLQATSIRIVDSAHAKPDFKALLKGSFVFVWPLFVFSLVYSFIVTGGIFLFVIPGLLFVFFFLFAPFELVLEKRGVLNSLRRSLAMTTEHFGPIFLRILLLVAVMFVLNIIFGFAGIAIGFMNAAASAGNSSDIQSSLVSFVFQIVMNIIGVVIGWLSLVYVYEMYKETRDRVAKDKMVPLKWSVITGIVGWVLGIILMTAFTGLIVAIFSSKDFQKGLQEGFQSSKQSSVNLSEEMNPQAKVHFDRSDELFDQIKAASDNPAVVTKLNDQNIAELKQAIQFDPQNPKIWYQLGNAYTWVSTSGTLEDGLKAYQQAEKLEPNNVAYINGVGDMMLRLDQNDQAVLQFQKSLRLTDNSGYANLSLGRAYTALKVYDLAKKHYATAIEIFTEENNNGAYDNVLLQARKESAALPK